MYPSSSCMKNAIRPALKEGNIFSFSVNKFESPRFLAIGTIKVGAYVYVCLCARIHIAPYFVESSVSLYSLEYVSRETDCRTVV